MVIRINILTAISVILLPILPLLLGCLFLDDSLDRNGQVRKPSGIVLFILSILLQFGVTGLAVHGTMAPSEIVSISEPVSASGGQKIEIKIRSASNFQFLPWSFDQEEVYVRWMSADVSEKGKSEIIWINLRTKEEVKNFPLEQKYQAHLTHQVEEQKQHKRDQTINLLLKDQN